MSELRQRFNQALIVFETVQRGELFAQVVPTIGDELFNIVTQRVDFIRLKAIAPVHPLT